MDNDRLDMACLLLLMRGRVQGVGFRWFVRDAALSMQVSGWVRNLDTGHVQAQIQGPRQRLEELIEKLKTGHPHARVDSVESREIAEEDAAGFEIR